ncbi:MAG TPA: hypothetical protein VLD40_04780 [Dissulfurispiraceae bacterium]|nr:hypothetical protein [Dissulfurispiraceae bacterium]
MITTAKAGQEEEMTYRPRAGGMVRGEAAAVKRCLVAVRVRQYGCGEDCQE